MPGLPPAHYDIAISAPGFALYNVKNVVLGVAQKARLDAKLQVGTASLQIIVAGEYISTVETQSSELAGTVTSREITQLQLNGRDFTQLIALVPGVSNQSSEDQGVGAPHFSSIFRPRPVGEMPAKTDISCGELQWASIITTQNHVAEACEL